jgi:hypothetical protein
LISSSNWRNRYRTQFRYPLKASAVMANDHSALRVDLMPFAGMLRESDLVVAGISHTSRDMQIGKQMIIGSN